MSDERLKHDGVTPGYLHIVAEEVAPDDVHPHPHPVNAARWEWLTRRKLRVELIERTEVTVEESLTTEEMAELRRKQEERGEESFADGSA